MRRSFCLFCPFFHRPRPKSTSNPLFGTSRYSSIHFCALTPPDGSPKVPQHATFPCSGTSNPVLPSNLHYFSGLDSHLEGSEVPRSYFGPFPGTFHLQIFTFPHIRKPLKYLSLIFKRFEVLLAPILLFFHKNSSITRNIAPLSWQHHDNSEDVPWFHML